MTDMGTEWSLERQPADQPSSKAVMGRTRSSQERMRAGTRMRVGSLAGLIAVIVVWLRRQRLVESVAI